MSYYRYNLKRGHWRSEQPLKEMILTVTGSEEIIRRKVRGVEHVLERRSYSHGVKGDDFVISDDVGALCSFSKLDAAIFEFSRMEAEFQTRIAA